MREIEFRAMNTNNQWRYGFLERESLLYDENYDCSSTIQIDTIGQYTGLKDKNGTKIFEGDILMFNKGRNLPNTKPIPQLVKWHSGDCAFEKYPFGKSITVANGGALLQPDMMTECEVIGNIYDNPELLELKVEN